jgi:ABC-type antimicrobial peptide transport system permease subunit
VVGIAADAKQNSWAGRPAPEIYLSAWQSGNFLGEPKSHSDYITLVLRTAGNAADLTNAVKQTVRSFDRNLPISEVLTMEGVVHEANAQPRFEMMLLSIFGGIALLLAAVGIYGVMSYSITQRTREIGIRISLGASRTGVLKMLVMQGMLLALTGAVVGVAGAALLSRLMKGLLYGVKPSDPLTFVIAGVVLAATAVLATLIPARRAMRIEPMTALRHE